MKRILILAVFFLSLNSYAQYFNNGQDRPGIKWKKIETPNFELIFPRGFEKKANELAHMMEKSYEYTTVSLNQKPKKVSIILHTETVKSNAFLGWAPGRIEMYTTPNQRIYSQDWIEQLAIHEYRHMVQVSKIETEMPKILRLLFGEQAAAFLTAAYMPFWFLEGDAVSAETGLSNSGRGRLPNFHRELKAQLVDKKKYSFSKAYLGSYKDNVANHYEMGYFLVGGARMLYGKKVWDEVLSEIARKPFSLRALNKGIDKSIGINKNELYDTVFNYLTNRWENEINSIDTTPFQQITTTSKNYTDYLYSYKFDSLYISEKSSFSDVTRFISIDSNGKEKKLFTPGYHFNESVSGRNNLLVWTERLSHPRWFHTDKSLLRIFDLNTNKLKEYKFDSKFFHPVISPDMKTIAVVEVDNLYEFYITLIDYETGEIIKKISTPENGFFITPSWSEDGRNMIAVVLINNEKAIAKINTESNKIEYLLPFSNQEIISPVEHNDTIYFIAGYTGVDNLYALTKKGNEMFEIISSRFGIRDYSFNNNEITYSNYSSDGYQLVKTNLDSIEYNTFDVNKFQYEYPIAKAISEQEKGIIYFDSLSKNNFETENYSKAAHLFNFHSWAPVSIDPYNYTAYPGISFMSQNMLSTSEFSAGYRYFIDEKEGELYAKYKFFGWLPVFDVEIAQGGHGSSYYEINNYTDRRGNIVRIDTVQKQFNWRETNLSLNTYIPINLSKGRYQRKIQPRLRYNYTNIKKDSQIPDFFPQGTYHSLETGIYLYHILNSSKQDLVPNFGALLDLSFVKSLPGIADMGSVFAASTVFYLPGITKNQGLSLYNGFQLKENAEYAFSDRIRYPRGHMHILNKQMYSFGSTYKIPLLYPDLSIGNWLYMKRVNLNTFYDFCLYKATNNQDKTTATSNDMLQSAGFELTSNINVLQFIAPIEIGFRYSYLFNENSKVDFFFNIEFTF